jgi:hypothetical protein
MSDVIISSSGTYHSGEAKNGNAVVSVTQVGVTQILSADMNVFVGSGTFFERLGGRFDDVRYYSGDSAS